MGMGFPHKSSYSMRREGEASCQLRGFEPAQKFTQEKTRSPAQRSHEVATQLAIGSVALAGRGWCWGRASGCMRRFACCWKQCRIRFQARLLFHTAGLTTEEPDAYKMLVQENSLCKVFLKLDVNMARFALELQESSKVKFEAAIDVAQAFVEDFRAAYPNADLKAYEKEWPATVKDPVVASRPASKPSVSLYEVNSAGETIDCVALLRGAGFEMGQEVAEGADGGVWTIKGVNQSGSDPNVRLQRQAATESLIETKDVPIRVFCADWVQKQAKHELKMHKGWPIHRTVSEHSATFERATRARIA